MAAAAGTAAAAVGALRGAFHGAAVAPSARQQRVSSAGVVAVPAAPTPSSRKGQAGVVVAQASKKTGGTQSGTKSGLLGTISNLPFGTVGLPFGTLSRVGGGRRRNDSNTIFVAGATGRLGARIVRELLQRGFNVRAGVRNPEKAQALLQAAQGLDLLDGAGGRRLQLVEVDLEQPDTIPAALAGAGRVVCAIGASESSLLDWSGPYRIDGKATEDLVEAAHASGVQQFVLVTSLGTTKFGLPASALNLFWGVLKWKGQAEKALQESGMAYTIVRPGGMERPADDYKLTHNLRLEGKDTLFGGLVSRLQVAEVVGECLTRPEAAENKVLEVVAETNAPPRTILDLLVDIPTAGPSQAERAVEADIALVREAELEAEADEDDEDSAPKKRSTVVLNLFKKKSAEEEEEEPEVKKPKRPAPKRKPVPAKEDEAARAEMEALRAAVQADESARLFALSQDALQEAEAEADRLAAQAEAAKAALEQVRIKAERVFQQAAEDVEESDEAKQLAGASK
eukprot:jgi/Chlat1/2895/Chrsp2S04629